MKTNRAENYTPPDVDGNERVKAQLQEIERSTVSIREEEATLILSLPHDCFIKVNTTEGSWYIEDFQVPPDLQGHGIGSRLMESLSSEIKNKGAEKLAGSLKSAGALGAMEKTFGSDRLTLRRDFETRENPDEDEIINREQALEDLADGRYVECEVDLDEITASSQSSLI